MSLRDTLIRHEGLRLFPYKDSVGKLTIGVGRNLEDQGITEEEALYLLGNDILQAASDLGKAFPVVFALSQDRYEVLVNMAFNLGISRLSKFKRMWAAIEIGDFNKASEEMLTSKWAVQVGSRATELAEIMRYGCEYKTIERI
jgi:lysozyme